MRTTTRPLLESRQLSSVHPIAVRGGMVTAMHPEAARAGAQALAAGGNAADAFVAAALAVGVVEPFMSGLAGHGTAVIRTNDGRLHTLDFVTRAPAAAAASADPFPSTGARAVPLPTAAHGFAALHAWLGRRTPEQLAAPAIGLAEGGVPLEGYTAAMIARHAASLADDPGARSVFLDADGRPWRPPTSASAPGDRLSLPAYARTLRAWVSDGPRLWREGPTADALLAWMAANDGWIREDDLRRAPTPAPAPAVSATFDGFDLHGADGTGAFPFVAQVLRMWGTDDDAPPGSVGHYHRLIECFRLAFADRDLHAGDPDGGRADPHRFLDPERARRLAARIRADRRLADVGDLVAASGDGARRRNGPGDTAGAPDRSCTTHVNTVDADGMVVAGTFTLGNPFGAAVVVPATGTLLPNVLYQYARDAGHPNELRPGLRPVWNGSPIVITRDGALVAAVGAPGARRIPTALVQVLLGRLRHGRSAQQAIEDPRVHAEGDLVELDDRVDPDVVQGLRALGHDVRLVREGPSSASFARPTCIEVLPDGALACGLDAGRLATAVGVPD